MSRWSAWLRTSCAGSARHACGFRESGVAIIIVEHALEVIESYCDRVIVMGGRRGHRRWQSTTMS